MRTNFYSKVKAAKKKNTPELGGVVFKIICA